MIEIKETHLVKHSGPRRILLVDDEELLRTITGDLLSIAGYMVEQASSGEDALQLIVSGSHPDAIVTDYAMRGMSGVQLAQEVEKIDAGIPILLTSGYAAIDDSARHLPRLSKPFGSRELIDAIEKLFAAEI